MKSAQREGEPPVLIEQWAYSEEEIAQISARVLRMCLSRGISKPHADDVVQDVWLWLARSGWPRLALSPGWILGVAWNFVRRHRRRRSHLQRREESRLVDVEEPAVLPDYSAIETGQILDRIEQGLPEIEKRFLALIRRGHTFARAAAMLHIPRGSRSYHLHRIVDLARKELVEPGPPHPHDGGTRWRQSHQRGGVGL